MRIAVLGAGFTGLTAAYYLTQQSHEVVVFEKEPYPGGLASGFKNKGWQWPLERFYHHFFAGDKEAIGLIREVGLGSKLFFTQPSTAIYYSPPQSEIINHKSPVYLLDSPLALLKFPHLSLVEKLRTGLVLAYLKILLNYHSLEQSTAKEWLTKTMGERPFKILWEPLLVAKFGKLASQVTAAWFWARIKKRSRSLGYLEGGFQILADRLVDKIKANGGQVIFKKPVQRIEKKNSQFIIHPPAGEAGDSPFDVVISTLPTPVFLKVAPRLPSNYQKNLSQIPHLWAQNLILEMNKPFLSDSYWLNINTTSFPFLAVVEHTHFINKSYYNNHHLLYIGNYLPNGHPYLKKSAQELLKIFTPYLKKINSQFDNLNSKLHKSKTQYNSTICNLQLFTAPYAQPVIIVGYKPPNLKTPIPNLYLANLDCVYPWDRGVNYAIELGEKAAKIVLSS